MGLISRAARMRRDYRRTMQQRPLSHIEVCSSLHTPALLKDEQIMPPRKVYEVDSFGQIITAESQAAQPQTSTQYQEPEKAAAAGYKL